MFFGVEFGTAYEQLAANLDPAQRKRWQASLAAAADYLINKGVVTWYTNGNINLGETEFFYLVWQATKDDKYRQTYEASWSFTLSPPQARWPGAGLVIVKAPTRSDGADGSGYLAETGAGGTGFDAEYTELQLEVASRLYLLSRDPRALRLANLMLNMLLPRVDSAWRLDTSGGTRHTEAVRHVGFLSSALTVLSLYGGRSDLAPLVSAQFTAEEGFFPPGPGSDNAVMRRALGNDVAVIALAAAGDPSPQAVPASDTTPASQTPPVPQTTPQSQTSSRSQATPSPPAASKKPAARRSRRASKHVTRTRKRPSRGECTPVTRARCRRARTASRQPQSSPLPGGR
jgi:hypothetical protein